MPVLSGLDPKEVFKYFEEICAIPHGSGNTKAISDYCVRFARDKGLRYIQDSSNNVIIFKDGAKGYESSSPVVLQGHLDMVCEKAPGRDIDFENDGLSLKVENGVVTADGTTLGGDDGIAVAMALTILAAEDLPHPPIEAVLTVDEEIGMLGAASIDCSPISGRTMINLDSENEGVLLAGCAGGATIVCRLPLVREQVAGRRLTVKINGLTGGHSGVEIDKGRANANQLMGRLLNELDAAAGYGLISVNGGLKDNAIPRECAAELVAEPENVEALKAASQKFARIFAAEYRATDPGLKIETEAGAEGSFFSMDKKSKKRAVASLVNLPGGIQRMSSDIPGLVQTSLNMGILATSEEEMTMSFSARSSVGTEKEEMIARVKSLMSVLGGTVNCFGDYPAWEYMPNSRLRAIMTEVFEKMYGHKPTVAAIHAGVECGLFAGKLPGLDCVSIGPDIKDIHTPAESMEAASVKRTWDYLLAVLKELK